MALDDVTLAEPRTDDGAAMWRVARAAGLDPNSPYKYLLFCRDFAGTSVVARDEGGSHAGPGDGSPAEEDGAVVGFVTGYRRPAAPDTLFVWQVGVLASCRGRGVASAMLDHLVATARTPLRFLEASVTPDNEPSQRLFTGFAARHGAGVERSLLFAADQFPEPHAEEVLLRIGPL